MSCDLHHNEPDQKCTLGTSRESGPEGEHRYAHQRADTADRVVILDDRKRFIGIETVSAFL